MKNDNSTNVKNTPKPNVCLIKSCQATSNHNNNLLFVRFPKNKSTHEKWRVACGFQWGFPRIGGHKVICSQHFHPYELITNFNGLTVACAVPSLRLGPIPTRTYQKRSTKPTPIAPTPQLPIEDSWGMSY